MKHDLEKIIDTDNSEFQDAYALMDFGFALLEPDRREGDGK